MDLSNACPNYPECQEVFYPDEEGKKQLEEHIRAVHTQPSVVIEPTPTGLKPDIMGEIDDAAKEFDLSKLMRLTNLPADVIVGKRIMSRKERRTWYRQNKARLNLPEWGKLGNLIQK